MKVRALHTKAFNLTTNDDLIAKIKREGKEVKAGAWPFGKSVQLHDMFFLLGGRGSIEKVLNSVPGGHFIGNPAKVLITTDARATKKYTIIAVCEGVYAGRFGSNKQAWGTMFHPYTNVVNFSAITGKLWSDENKIQDGILEYAGIS